MRQTGLIVTVFLMVGCGSGGGDQSMMVDSTPGANQAQGKGWQPIPSSPVEMIIDRQVLVGPRLVVMGHTLDKDGNTVPHGVIYDLDGKSWAIINLSGAPANLTINTSLSTFANGKLYFFSFKTISGASLLVGQIYNTNTKTWSAASTVNAPSSIAAPFLAAINGKFMFYSFQNSQVSGGALYDPASDTWTTIPGVPAVQSKSYWTGSQVVAYSEHSAPYPGNSNYVHTEFEVRVYDPKTNSVKVASASPLSSRGGCSTYWTGTQLIVWGGQQANSLVGNHPVDPSVPTGTTYYNDGALYDPATDTWSSMSVQNAPAANPVATYGNPYQSLSVTTGSDWVVLPWSSATASGSSVAPMGTSIYRTASNQWLPVQTSGAPTICGVTKYWTGSDLIHWGDYGGNCASPSQSALWIYSVASNTWLQISDRNTPHWRTSSTSAYWTGSKLIVWQGRDTSGNVINSVFDANVRAWSVMDMTRAPSDRTSPFVSWTGQALVVFGGTSPTSGAPFADGAVYYP